MILDLDNFDVSKANVFLSAVNSPKIRKGSADYELFKEYYRWNASQYEKIITGIDADSKILALLFSKFINGCMTKVYLPASGLEGAIMKIVDTPLGAESL